MIALPTGDSFESLFSAGLASADPTMWYSNVCLADHARGEQAVLELRDLVLEHRLFVLGVVVLCVLGDIAELPSNTNPLSDLAALVAA